MPTLEGKWSGELTVAVMSGLAVPGSSLLIRHLFERTACTHQYIRKSLAPARPAVAKSHTTGALPTALLQ
jgi:hypothetical protein